MGTGRPHPSPPPPTSSRKRAVNLLLPFRRLGFEPGPLKIGFLIGLGLLAQGGEDSEEAAAVQGTDDTGGDDGVGCVPADGGEAGRCRAAHRRPWPPLRHSYRQGDFSSLFRNFLVLFDGYMCSSVLL